MRTICLLLTIVVLAFQTVLGQEVRRRPGDPLPEGDVGILHITPAPGQIPHSLQELAAMSTLIVEGVVRTTLPPREPSRGSLETDAVISVSRKLKGVSVAQEIVISQRGGVRSNLNIRPAQYALVQPGEQYILFLTEDTRPNIPQAPGGLQRYLVTGIWSGLFYLEAGRMRLKADEPDALRRRYQGFTTQQLLAEVTTALAH